MERFVEVKWQDERLAVSVHYPPQRQPYEERAEEGKVSRVPLTIIATALSAAASVWTACSLMQRDDWPTMDIWCFASIMQAAARARGNTGRLASMR